jgi:hypothetical protein
MTLSGFSQRIAAPGDPGCFPRFRFRPARSAARRSFLAGGLRPGRSSALGGIEEFPEFLDAARRAASSCSRSSATSASSAATRSPCPAICPSCASSRAACSRISASRGSSGGSESVTARDHPRNQPRPPSRHPARSATVTSEPVTRSHSKAPINRGPECLPWNFNGGILSSQWLALFHHGQEPCQTSRLKRDTYPMLGELRQAAYRQPGTGIARG